ncbi:MAG TPA: non-homologous end-joining DNA ligase [Longimicrobiales bacterium]
MDTPSLIEALERAERDREPVEIEGLRFTSLDRVVWPRARLTKGDLVRYYVRVADVMLRYIGDRPLMLKRYPGGIDSSPVVQQRVTQPVPDDVRTARAPTAAGERVERYIGARATLFFAAQMDAIEIHAWHSRIAAPNRPDWIVLDLDPSPGAGFRKVVRIARALRERIEALGLTAAVKTSGSRGLHLHVPTGGAVSYDEAAELARRLAERVAEAEPSFATVRRAVDERGYRVYIDHLQNARGKTAVAPYSLRARPRAPVAMPIRWEEVDDALDPREFRLPDVPARLADEGDAWAEAFRRPAGDIERALERLRA